MATITVDGRNFDVGSDKNLLETLLWLGFDLPYFCWHPSLGSVGSCRQCAVKKIQGENGDRSQLVMACMEPTIDGMEVSIQDKQASEFRANVIEWLMLNHPHDCPVCDEGGECHLQDMTVMTGHAYRRSRFKKRTHLNQDLGPCINHEMNRCIQCYRCVRFYNDYAGGDDLQVFSAHDNVYFGRHQDGTLESEFSGNLVEVCPTGVFTDKTLKSHYTRKWDLTSAPSVCHHCSLGCNILAGERYGSLRRILNRYNPEVNGYFICDRGRFGYDFVNAEDRILVPRERDRSEVILESSPIIASLKTALASGEVKGVGSPRASLESNFALRELVGSDNFYNGMSGGESELVQLALDFLSNGPVKSTSLTEIEHCDAVIVIGEDLTNTAPMMDLALNQSVRVQPLEQLGQVGIPEWNDAAAREYLQNQKGPLYLLMPQPSKLSRIATKSFRRGIPELIRLLSEITGLLDPSNGPTKVQQPASGSPNAAREADETVKEIAAALATAKRPLVIAGTSMGSLPLMQAAINIAIALHRKNENTRVSFVFPECNTAGAAMMEEKSLPAGQLSGTAPHTLIVLENDLYRRGTPNQIDEFINRFKQVLVLDHSETPTTARADLVLASGTFAEADGSLVNHEGRVQRFIQVQAADELVLESWRWILKLGKLVDNQKLTAYSEFDHLVDAIEQGCVQFAGIARTSLPADYRVHGQRLTRAPHRYSGRTSMFANHSVSEPRPPQDQDSPFSFTMEGHPGIPPESATSHYWSPGWNSVQSITKFRSEISRGRQQSDPGVRLIEPSGKAYLEYLKLAQTHDHQWQLVPLHHIFGSEEMSIKSPAIAARSPEPKITLNSAQAEEHGIKAGSTLAIIIDDQETALPVQLDADWPTDHIGITAGLPGLPYMEGNSIVQLKPPGNEN
ncbi:MAG: NADH-quinone oxidoreductase subunit G [Cyclobacteriaceae bacterium]|nr:MAG: NADH-quinone oxidoreductase subunit G [Cyclobacteriaceae bacterium]